MTDLIFWMGIILCVGVFGWFIVGEIIRRTDHGESPLTLLMAVKIFLVVCGVICLSIGRNSFTPKNLDAGGDDSKVTVTDKDVRDTRVKREKRIEQKKTREKKETKKNEDDLLDDMKDFKKRVMER